MRYPALQILLVLCAACNGPSQGQPDHGPVPPVKAAARDTAQRAENVAGTFWRESFF